MTYGNGIKFIQRNYQYRSFYFKWTHLYFFFRVMNDYTVDFLMDRDQLTKRIFYVTKIQSQFDEIMACAPFVCNLCPILENCKECIIPSVHCQALFRTNFKRFPSAQDNKIFDRMLVEELSSNKYPISHAISLIKVCKKVKKHIKAIFYLLLKMCPR